MINIHMPNILSTSVLPFFANNKMPINAAKKVPIEKTTLNVVFFFGEMEWLI